MHKLDRSMKLKQSLTKENFWNDIYLRYPKSAKLFCLWIDQYKESVRWNVIFNMKYKVVEEDKNIHSAPKFHDLPYAIQQGIWIEFSIYILNEYFEQPEYIYAGSLADDIEKVMAFLEPEIWIEDK